MKWPSIKLDYTKLGPFKIKKRLSPVMFELELLKNSRIHPVFHAVLLKIALAQISVQSTLQVQEEKEYEVKEILDSRETEKGQEYLML